MKTIADYQPDILIREAINYAARQWQVKDEQVHLIAMLVAGDMGRQQIIGEDIVGWTRKAVEDARAKLAR